MFLPYNGMIKKEIITSISYLSYPYYSLFMSHGKIGPCTTSDELRFKSGPIHQEIIPPL